MSLNKNNVDAILQRRIIFQEDGMNPVKNKIIKYGYSCYSDHYDAVIYLNNNTISYFPTSPNFQCISFGFSGCYMARFQLNNKFFAAHIPPGMKNIWNDFVNRNNEHIIGCIFNPTQQMCYGKGPGKYPGDKIWGIITNQNVCIAIKVYENYEYVYDKSERKMVYNKLGASRIYMSSIIRTTIEATNYNLYIH